MCLDSAQSWSARPHPQNCCLALQHSVSLHLLSLSIKDDPCKGFDKFFSL